MIASFYDMKLHPFIACICTSGSRSQHVARKPGTRLTKPYDENDIVKFIFIDALPVKKTSARYLQDTKSRICSEEILSFGNGALRPKSSCFYLH